MVTRLQELVADDSAILSFFFVYLFASKVMGLTECLGFSFSVKTDGRVEIVAHPEFSSSGNNQTLNCYRLTFF